MGGLLRSDLKEELAGRGSRNEALIPKAQLRKKVPGLRARCLLVACAEKPALARHCTRLNPHNSNLRLLGFEQEAFFSGAREQVFQKLG